jgi:hypothetical protein
MHARLPGTPELQRCGIHYGRRYVLLAWLGFLVISIAMSRAQTPTFEWVRRAGGALDDFGQRIAVDGAGNIYAIGFFQGDASFSGRTLTSAGNWDIAIAKYSPFGDLLWVRQAGGPGADYCYGIALDATGNVVLTGRFTEPATFGTTTLPRRGSYADMFIAKYDASGEFQWAQGAGGGNEAAGQSVAVDAAGDIYVTGFFTGTTSFGTTNLTSVGGADIFIAKYGSAGALQWVQRAGGPATDRSSGSDFGSAIVVDGAGNFYVAGLFDSRITFGRFTLVNPYQNPDIFLVRFDTNAVPQWARSLGHAQDQGVSGIAVDGDGNCIVAGGGGRQLQFGYLILNSSGGNDGYVAKYSTAGIIQWAHLLGGPGDDEVSGRAVGGSGDCYLAGEFEGTATFVGTNLTSAGSRDAFVVKLNSAGVFQWAQRAGGPGLDRGFGVALDATGSPFVIGDFSDAARFGPLKVASAGLSDFFLAKLFGPPNATPVPADDALTTPRDTQIVVPTATLTANDSDPDGDPLRITSVNSPTQQGGTVSLLDGLLIYRPATNVVGTDAFTYTVTDGPGDSAAGTVRVIVTDGTAGTAPPPFQWVRQGGVAAGGSNYSQAQSIAVAPDGSSCVTGQFSGSASFGGANLTSFGRFDMYVAKYSAAGEIQWVRHAGSTDSSMYAGASVALDQGGNCYVAGIFEGTANFGPTNLVSSGGGDIFLAKYDPAGSLLWVLGAGGPDFDSGNAVALDQAQNIYLTGSIRGSATFGTTNIDSSVDRMFLAKYDKSGAVQWVRTAAGGQSFSVAVDSTGNAVVSGFFWAGVDFGTTNLATVAAIFSGCNELAVRGSRTAKASAWIAPATVTSRAAFRPTPRSVILRSRHPTSPTCSLRNWRWSRTRRRSRAMTGWKHRKTRRFRSAQPNSSPTISIWTATS